MLLETYKKFDEYALLDSGEGYRLEQWGPYRLARPDPQIIWPRAAQGNEWEKADAIFKKNWQVKTSVPKSWIVNYQNIKLVAKLSPFKHTGIFAEQAAQWEWMQEKLKGTKNKLRILNLFAYTGAASMVLTRLGHFVTHVDASKPSLAWAKENQTANNFSNDAIRWILDDAVKFVRREIKRGQNYDGIIMDPPAFGHSPSGAVWKFNENLPGLLETCVSLLSPQAKFLIINGYATNSSALALKNVLEDAMNGRGGDLEFGELCLRQKNYPVRNGAGNDRLISTGIFARWSA